MLEHYQIVSFALRVAAGVLYRSQSALLIHTMADRSEDSAVASSQGSQASNVLTTKVDPTSARFEANMRFLADLMSQVRNEGEEICEGGGNKAIENQHGKGRLTARERIELLADPKSFFELGLYAAHGMYEEWGGAPAAGVITGNDAVLSGFFASQGLFSHARVTNAMRRQAIDGERQYIRAL